MSSSSSRTVPVTQPPSDSSCMRLRQRSNVLLPHPDGPITAVTVRLGNMTDTSFTTARRPNSAVRRTASSWRRASAGGAGATALPNGPAGRESEEQHERHEHQRRRPGEPVPLLEGTGRVGEDLEGQGLHRAADAGREIQVAERRKQQRGRLACYTGDPYQAPGDDAGQSRARHDAERGPPARIPERQGGFPQRVRHQPDHLFGGAREHQDHEHRERHASRQCGEVAHRLHEPAPGEYADHDRRGAVHHVRQEAHRPSQPAGAVLRQEQPRPDTYGETDQPGEADDDRGPDDRIGDAAAGLARGDGVLREEVPVEGRRALHDQVRENEDQGQDGEERQQGDEPRHDTAHDATPNGAGAHSARLPTAVPRATRQMSRRARAFTTTVITNSTRPTSNSAARYRFVVASLNSLAIAAAIVYAGCSTDMPMSWRVPITKVTAIVSPRARPRPSMTAPIRPARP